MGRAISQDPLMAYNFHLEIDGFRRVGWTQVTGLKGVFDIAEYQEGGSNFSPQKSVGRATFPNVTCVRGQIYDPDGEGGDDIYAWYTQHYSVLVRNWRDPNYRRSGNLLMYREDGTLAVNWRFPTMFIAEFTPCSDLDGSSTAHSYETLVFGHEGFIQVGGIAPPQRGQSLNPVIGL